MTEEIYFTKRITRFGVDTLLVVIPRGETMFEYDDLVKITLLRKAEVKKDGTKII